MSLFKRKLFRLKKKWNQSNITVNTCCTAFKSIRLTSRNKGGSLGQRALYHSLGPIKGVRIPLLQTVKISF